MMPTNASESVRSEIGPCRKHCLPVPFPCILGRDPFLNGTVSCSFGINLGRQLQRARLECLTFGPQVRKYIYIMIYIYIKLKIYIYIYIHRYLQINRLIFLDGHDVLGWTMITTKHILFTYIYMYIL